MRPMRSRARSCVLPAHSSIGFAFIGSLILLKVVDFVVGLRVDEEGEQVGLDLTEHDENAYALEA